MRTLGVDLSADPRKTAACLVEWDNGSAQVHRPVLGLDDDSLLSRLLGEDEHELPDWTGIDAPFGWPQLFVAAVRGWQEGESWPSTPRPELRYRVTDIFVTQQSRRPLSVSSDRIAVTAMRCARLLTAVAERRGLGRALDRTGADRVVEVYPGAALPLWSDEVGDVRLDPQGYKAADDSGMPTCERGVPSRPSSPSTTSCGPMSRIVWPGWCSVPTGSLLTVLRCPGVAAVTAGARTGAGRGRGVRSRFLTGCVWTSPMMTRCACLMRRSTSRCSCKDAARCGKS